MLVWVSVVLYDWWVSSWILVELIFHGEEGGKTTKEKDTRVSLLSNDDLRRSRVIK